MWTAGHARSGPGRPLPDAWRCSLGGGLAACARRGSTSRLRPWPAANWGERAGLGPSLARSALNRMWIALACVVQIPACMTSSGYQTTACAHVAWPLAVQIRGGTASGRQRDAVGPSPGYACCTCWRGLLTPGDPARRVQYGPRCHLQPAAVRQPYLLQ